MTASLAPSRMTESDPEPSLPLFRRKPARGAEFDFPGNKRNLDFDQHATPRSLFPAPTGTNG